MCSYRRRAEETNTEFPINPDDSGLIHCGNMNYTYTRLTGSNENAYKRHFNNFHLKFCNY